MQTYGPPPTGYHPPPGYYPPYGLPYPFVLARPPRLPRPRGIPRRGWFLTGAVGQFIAAGLSITLGVLVLVAPRLGPGGWYPLMFTWLGAVVGAAFGSSLLVQILGFHGLWRNYGSLIGGAAVAYGFAAVAVFLLASLLAPLSIEQVCNPWWCFEQISSWGWALVLAAYAMLGAMFIVCGSAFIVNRFFLGNPGAAVASGILFIIAGSLLASFVMALYGGFFVLAPALIVGGVVLVRAPLPHVLAGRPPAATPPGGPLPPGPLP